MERFILDTNLFFNMQAAMGLGNKTQDIIVALTKKIKQLSGKKKAEFFMPPLVVDELLSFFEDPNQPFLKDFLSVVTVKSPNMHEIQFPAELFYRLVADIRDRNYRGLRVGEEEIENAGHHVEGKNIPEKKDFQIAIGGIIKKFRDRYRLATRVGFLDSVADLDLITLAKEQDGYVVSTDEGVLKWGRAFGVKELLPAALSSKLDDLLHQE